MLKSGNKSNTYVIWLLYFTHDDNVVDYNVLAETEYVFAIRFSSLGHHEWAGILLWSCLKSACFLAKPCGPTFSL
jgi:hypothetical protein